MTSSAGAADASARTGRINEQPDPDRAGLRGALGQVLTGEIAGLRPDGRRIISNPFDLTREASARSIFGPIGEGTA